MKRKYYNFTGLTIFEFSGIKIEHMMLQYRLPEDIRKIFSELPLNQRMLLTIAHFPDTKLSNLQLISGSTYRISEAEKRWAVNEDVPTGVKMFDSLPVAEPTYGEFKKIFYYVYFMNLSITEAHNEILYSRMARVA